MPLHVTPQALPALLSPSHAPPRPSLTPHMPLPSPPPILSIRGPLVPLPAHPMPLHVTPQSLPALLNPSHAPPRPSLARSVSRVPSQPVPSMMSLLNPARPLAFPASPWAFPTIREPPQHVCDDSLSFRLDFRVPFQLKRFRLILSYPLIINLCTPPLDKEEVVNAH
jgi:hypothetical protein